MSRKDRQEALKKQLENLKGGIYGETFHENVIDEARKAVTNIDINSLTPAPNEWNFFPEISENKMLEMIFSIQENGLFNPIIVWEQEEGYMILSGHNRTKAYKAILEEYKDTPGFDEGSYKTIPAIVYRKNEIGENKAKEIIIDTNYIQREEDKRLMPQIIKNRLEIVRSREDIKGRTIDIVAEELGLSKTKVYEDQVIANNIIPQLSELYFNDIIRKKSLLRFNWFSKGIQEWIHNAFKDNITDVNIMKLRKTMNKEEIGQCFRKNKDNVKLVTVGIRVPENLKEDFREMAMEWVKERELKN